jgi:hypothetical protein
MNLSIYKRLQGDKNTYNIRTGVRVGVVKTLKVLVNPITQDRQVFVKDQNVEIEFTEMFGHSGRVYIEPVIDNRGVSYYTTKSTSRGLTSGYLEPGM